MLSDWFRLFYGNTKHQRMTMKKLIVISSIIIMAIDIKVLGLPMTTNQEKLDPFWDNLNSHCGSELADELEGICNGKYNELPAGVSQSITHRRKLGIPLITEECCYNPCTRRTLKEYCAPSQQ